MLKKLILFQPVSVFLKNYFQSRRCQFFCPCRCSRKKTSEPPLSGVITNSSILHWYLTLEKATIIKELPVFFEFQLLPFIFCRTSDLGFLQIIGGRRQSGNAGDNTRHWRLRGKFYPDWCSRNSTKKPPQFGLHEYRNYRLFIIRIV